MAHSPVPIKKLSEYMLILRREKVAPGSKQNLFNVFMEHVKICRDNLDEHYEQNSSIFAFWISKYENEKFRLKRLERKYERLYSERYMSHKRRSTARTSETEIKARVSADSNLNDIQDKIDAVEYRVGILKAVVEIMKIRNDSIINLGATVRKEMGTYDSSSNRRPIQRRDKFARKD